MRVAVTSLFVLMVLVVSGWAQQNKQFKVKSTPEKAPKQSAAMGKTGAGNTTAASANAKSLQTIEHENSKTPSAARSANASKRTTPAIKPVKDKNPAINFNGAGSGAKKTGGTTTGSNPYAGRLKQKGKRSQ